MVVDRAVGRAVAQVKLNSSGSLVKDPKFT